MSTVYKYSGTDQTVGEDSLTSESYTPPTNDQNFKKKLVMLGVLILLTALVLIFVNIAGKNSTSNVATKFISALQQNNITKARALYLSSEADSEQAFSINVKDVVETDLLLKTCKTQGEPAKQTIDQIAYFQTSFTCQKTTPSYLGSEPKLVLTHTEKQVVFYEVTDKAPLAIDKTVSIIQGKSNVNE